MSVEIVTIVLVKFHITHMENTRVGSYTVSTKEFYTSLDNSVKF